MPISEARKRANQKWDKANMKNLACTMRREKAEAFQAACKEAGTTPNAEFNKTVDNFLATHPAPGNKEGPAE